ncbi:MAG: RCC1 repeat-containing protein [Betaproteobacteria bacterium]
MFGLTSGVVAITMGSEHACALTGAGAVKCWGSGYAGQLGNDDFRDPNIAATVTGLSSGIVAITAGANHTCALTAAGGVKCWGSNQRGQIGDGTTTTRRLAVDVPGLGAPISAISANGDHVCAVTGGGAVNCWGENFSGQVGDGTSTERHSPTAVSGLASGARAVASGIHHSCARMETGGMKCWGNNDYGQLGRGSTLPSLTPVDVIGLGGSVLELKAGYFHTCASLAGGGVQCWGYNVNGELGDGTTTPRTQPVAVAGITTGVTSLATGYRHSCIVIGGAVKCWGANYDQQLGDAARPRLTAVDVATLTTDVAAVAAATWHSCAVTTAGAMKCWGQNVDGELGDGTQRDQFLPVTPLGLGAGVTAIAVGRYSSCALTATGGAKCWGLKALGQLGVATTANELVPNDVVGLTSGVAAIAVGDNHACAVTAPGGLKCWGYNYAGAVGDGTLTQRNTPVDVTGLASGVTAVSGGSYHTCAVVNGGVKCWGRNDSGQLGDGTATTRPTAVDVTGLTGGVTMVAAGSNHTCALTTLGSVKCWGNSGYGQLGSAADYPQLTPADVPGAQSGVTSITSGLNYTCAIVGGASRCWGDNKQGKLGDGTAYLRRDPTIVLGLESAVTSIEAGDTHTCAVVAGGARCWGVGNHGQTGEGIATYSATPMAARVSPLAVIEFYNTPLDNYFITADTVEAAAIDNGSAGPGWARTGNVFASAGGVAVCRFYGSLSPGPNSHFYTASASECADLVALQAATPTSVPRWNFESRDFLTMQPVNGACPDRTSPIYRAYNNGFSRRVDSNHRITNNLLAIQEVGARGWVSEGIVMCVPQ